MVDNMFHGISVTKAQALDRYSLSSPLIKTLSYAFPIKCRNPKTPLYRILTISSPNPSSVRTRPNRRPRERINSLPSIQVIHNALLIPLIQRRTRHTPSWYNTTTPANLEIQTLRIQLRTIVILTAMQGNDFVANDIVPWCEVARDGC